MLSHESIGQRLSCRPPSRPESRQNGVLVAGLDAGERLEVLDVLLDEEAVQTLGTDQHIQRLLRFRLAVLRFLHLGIVPGAGARVFGGFVLLQLDLTRGRAPGPGTAASMRLGIAGHDVTRTK